MTPLDMHLLLTSLEAIEHVCMQEKANAQSGKKASNKGKKSNKQPGTESRTRVLNKACTSIATSARNMGTQILCTIQETVISMRRTERRNLISMPQEWRKETQFCKEKFGAVEQEIGQA
jgi:hypothetical protein